MHWEQLNAPEQAYFFNDKAYFERKKMMLTEVSGLHDLEQTLHANMKVAPDDERRAQLRSELIQTNKKKETLWAQIDDFTHTQTPPADIKALMQRRQNLATYISRTKKMADKQTDKAQKQALLDKVTHYQTELNTINTQLA